MKFLILIVLLCASLYSGLAELVKFHQNAYKESLNTWKSLKLKNYDYTVVSFREENVGRTTIKVRNGKVVRRTYIETKLFYYPGDYEEFWDEKTPEGVGSHEGEFPYYDIVPAVTLDEVYTFCQNEILTQDLTPEDLEESKAVFEMLKGGIISKCAFYPPLCYGCSTFVFIENVKKRCE